MLTKFGPQRGLNRPPRYAYAKGRLSTAKPTDTPPHRCAAGERNSKGDYWHAVEQSETGFKAF